MRYDQYDIFGDDPIIKCRRCGAASAVDTLADAVVWAEAHESRHATGVMASAPESAGRD